MKVDLIDLLHYLAKHIEVGVAATKISSDIDRATTAINDRLHAHQDYADKAYIETESGEHEIRCLQESLRRLKQLKTRSFLGWAQYKSSPDTAAILRATADAVCKFVNLRNGDCFPLSPIEQQVLDIIESRSIGEAVLGRVILDELPDPENGKEKIDQSRLTKDIIPVLRKYRSVHNRPNLGYYVDRLPEDVQET